MAACGPSTSACFSLLLGILLEQERDLGLVIVHVKILQMARAKRCLTKDLPIQCVQAMDVQFKLCGYTTKLFFTQWCYRINESYMIKPRACNLHIWPEGSERVNVRFEKVSLEARGRSRTWFFNHICLSGPTFELFHSSNSQLSHLAQSSALSRARVPSYSFYKLVFHLFPLNSWHLPSNRSRSVLVTWLLSLCRNAFTGPAQEMLLCPKLSFSQDPIQAKCL